MISFDRIAFCTDFSEGSDQAFEVAIELARERNSQLYIIHAIPPMISPSPVMEEFIADQTPFAISEEILTDSVEKIRSIYLKRLEGYDKIEIKTLNGYPSTQIVQFAKDNNIDLIVMGSHGLTGLAYVFFGSTTEKVMRKAPCSVLAVRPAQQ